MYPTLHWYKGIIKTTVKLKPFFYFNRLSDSLVHLMLVTKNVVNICRVLMSTARYIVSPATNIIGHCGRSSFRPVSSSVMVGGCGTAPINNGFSSSSSRVLSSFSYFFLYVAASGNGVSADGGGFWSD